METIALHIQQFSDLLNKHKDTLPSEAFAEFSQWFAQFPVDGSISTSSTITTTNTPAITASTKNNQQHSQSSKKPKKQQFNEIHVIIMAELQRVFTIITSSTSAIQLPIIVPTTSLPNLPTSVNVGELEWTPISLKKSKDTTDLTVFTLPTILRTANQYIRTLGLPQSTMNDDEEDGNIKNNLQITPQLLATQWSLYLQPLLQQYIKNDYQYIPETSQDPDFIENINTIMKNQITVHQPDNDSRYGCLDFYYTTKPTNFTSNTLDSTESLSNDKKRKTIPITPTISPSEPLHKQQKHNTSVDDADSEDVTLITNCADKDFTTLSGLFDFTPTTGDCRHCTNPDTNGMQNYGFDAMGYIDSVFRSKFSTPRQGNASETTYGSLTLHKDVRADSLDGLDQYSHVWLVFIFHSNKMATYKPKITPPRLGERVGWLSTRSPHRYNDIGLSLVKLERIEYPHDFAHLPKNHSKRSFNVHSPGINSKAKNLPGCARLIFSGVDLIDGTPILDIKPYTPGDVIPSHVPVKLPQWLAEAKPYTLDIKFHNQCMADLFGIFKDHYAKQFESMYKLAEDGTIKPGQEKRDEILFKMSEFSAIYDNNMKNIENVTSERSVTLQKYLTQQLSSPLEFYTDIAHIQRGLLETLRNDPRPIQTKQQTRARSIYGFLFDNLNVVYQMTGENEATVCFVQHRSEYLMLQVANNNSNIRTGGNTVDSSVPQQLLYKQGWMELIKKKLHNTTVNVTDNWFFDMGIDKPQEKQ